MLTDQRIQELWAEELARARALIPSFQQPVLFTTMSGSRRIGLHHNLPFGMSKVQVSVNILTEDKMRNTMRHELAHALVWLLHKSNEGHGPLWRFYCKQLGIEPVRCGDGSDVMHPNPIVIVKCNDCGRSTKHAKTTQAAKSIEAGEQRYRCGYCKSHNLSTERPARDLTPVKLDASVVRDYEIKRRPWK